MRTYKQTIADTNYRNQSIIDLCKRSPASVADMCALLGLKRKTIENYVNRLKQEGYIKSHKHGLLTTYIFTGKEYEPVLARAENKWVRRKLIMEQCLERPLSFRQLAEMHKLTIHVIKKDVYHLLDMGILEVHTNFNSRLQEGATYKTVQVKNVRGEPVMVKGNFTDLPDFLKRMMGVNEINPSGGKVYKHMDKPVRPEPLRKMNYAWMNHQSGLEAA